MNCHSVLFYNLHISTSKFIVKLIILHIWVYDNKRFSAEYVFVRLCINKRIETEVNNILTNLNPPKSSGYDQVSPEILKHCQDDDLMRTFNNMIDLGIYPDVLKIQKNHFNSESEQCYYSRIIM